MTTPLEAIVEDGMLRPLARLPFADQQHVWILVEPLETRDVADWLENVARHQVSVLTRVGTLPDSTVDIAEDRSRDL